jgi:hypothetical protein
MRLRRYWFSFAGAVDPFRLGCGLSAYDREDAFRLLRERVFKTEPIPVPSNVVEDIDVSGLDPDHVLPNIGNVTIRGVWFPKGLF